MYRFISAFLILLTTSVFAQQTVKTVNISKVFSTTAGTPRVVRDGFQHVWLVAWRQQGSPSKIEGRIVKSDGSLLAAKVLASGVSAAAKGFSVIFGFGRKRVRSRLPTANAAPTAMIAACAP